MKLVYVPICTGTDTVDVTAQDYLATLRETRLVGNSACYTSSCITITWCCPTCLIPTEIKFDVLYEKIDVVNKASPYVIKFVYWIVTVLYFLCFCVVVANVLTILFEASADSSPPVQCHHRIQHPSTRGDTCFHLFHPGHHTLQCIHHGKKFQEDSQVWTHGHTSHQYQYGRRRNLTISLTQNNMEAICTPGFSKGMCNTTAT